MRRLLVSREHPPSPGGGIGTYSLHLARALAETGETVHVVAQRWPGAETSRTEALGGRLVIHRLPVETPGWLAGTRAHPSLPAGPARELFRRGGPAAAFAWQVAELAETLAESAGIDLIEAPEYEAPLYFVVTRPWRRVRRPACVVHLHSPSDLIASANGEDPSQCALPPLEALTIRAADALLCPSAYLARQVTARFGLPADAVAVIPYPLGDTPRMTRTDATWSAGPILFVGRLELRKGILEWIEAAVALARDDPSARFAFVGSDHVDAQLGGTGNLRARIPASLRGRFVFHEPRERSGVRELLAGARAVVVPSRWENFPYACIEAMASGAPVIVSPEGGMAEMVEHGVTGWIASSSRAVDLARAAREALGEGAAGLAAAGARAADAIRKRCDESTVVARQIELAERAVQRAGSHPPDAPPLPLANRDAEAWRDAPTGPRERAAALAGSVRRAASRPLRTAREIARRLRWRLMETPR